MCCVQVREHTSHLEAELEKHMAAASAECQNYATEVAGVSVPVQVGLVGALRPGQGAARSAWQREDLSTRCGDTISAGKAFKSECFLIRGAENTSLAPPILVRSPTSGLALQKTIHKHLCRPETSVY